MGRLEELDWISVGIVDLDLSAAGTSLHLITTSHPGLRQRVDLRRQICDTEDDSIPSAGLLGFAAGHRARSRRARPTEQQRAAGFEDINVETVQLASRVTAQEAAQGIVLGSPFRAEIERLELSALERALTAVTEALLPWDGQDATMSAHIATAIR